MLNFDTCNFQSVGRVIGRNGDNLKNARQDISAKVYIYNLFSHKLKSEHSLLLVYFLVMIK